MKNAKKPIFYAIGYQKSPADKKKVSIKRHLRDADKFFNDKVGKGYFRAVILEYFAKNDFHVVREHEQLSIEGANV